MKNFIVHKNSTLNCDHGEKIEYFYSIDLNTDKPNKQTHTQSRCFSTFYVGRRRTIDFMKIDIDLYFDTFFLQNLFENIESLFSNSFEFYCCVL